MRTALHTLRYGHVLHFKGCFHLGNKILVITRNVANGGLRVADLSDVRASVFCFFWTAFVWTRPSTPIHIAARKKSPLIGAGPGWS